MFSAYIKFIEINIENVKSLANCFIFLGAIFVSISTEYAQQAWPFFFFLIAHVLWGTCAVIMKDKKLIQLNFGFLIFDTWAIVLRLM